MRKHLLVPTRRLSALVKLLLLLLSILLSVVAIFYLTIEGMRQNGIHGIALSDSDLERHSPALRMALVIPFTASDTSQVLKNLHTTWLQHAPCSIHRNYAASIDLVFYFHRDILTHANTVQQLINSIESEPVLKQCFASVRFVNALLTMDEDAYPVGPSRMFFKLFNTLKRHPLLGVAPSLSGKREAGMHHQAIYYMEPDNLPCRASWLDRLYEEASIPGDFWMRGSILRNEDVSVGEWTFAEHINGNALYRVDDAAFLKFLSLVEGEMSRDLSGDQYLHSYDVAIDLVRRNRSLVGWSEFANTAAKFQFTETVQNWYRTPVNATELCHGSRSTYLVHGREKTDGKVALLTAKL
ncbi:hypothetical protein BJ741DRAFT_683359 [Chytriomyces cf. hyalinus JEL632]|nr:hypothetical protein BJ741DRAFT_683359 [Chytriomyces cf. hyalinus JEL632]